MLKDHNLVIGDVEKIADLPKYLKYWHDRMQGVSLSEYATTINSQISPAVPATTYYLLSDIHPDDMKIRTDLQKERLSTVIQLQQEERYISGFNRKCLFCKQVLSDRRQYFQHMFEVHGFNIGLPDNLVNVNLFLDVLEQKIKDNICIYCERIFKDYTTLKLHMRKKKHFKINARNKEYDQFYIINYLEEGKSWEEIQTESEDDDDEEGLLEENWDDWQEDESSNSICLLCETVSRSPDECFAHMKEVHNFDFHKIANMWGLEFYCKIRLINYVRHQIRSKAAYIVTSISALPQI